MIRKKEFAPRKTPFEMKDRIMPSDANPKARVAVTHDNAYTAEEVTEMTANIQKTLCVGRMYTPRDPLYVLTPTEALKTLLREIGLDSNILVVLFANYLVDLSMHDA